MPVPELLLLLHVLLVLLRCHLLWGMPAHLVALPVPRVLHAAHHVPHDVQRIHDGA